MRPGGSDGGDAGAAGTGNEQQAIALAFDPAGSITLNPKESRVLTVRATEIDDGTPVPQIPIRFALLGGDAAADAVLDATDVLTDKHGIAHVTLVAPSQPTMFSVRASNPRGQVEQQGVNVRASGITALLVTPSYSGHRTVTKWTATARAGASCSELDGTPPPDGNLVTSAKPDSPLVLEVPVGMNLAITVRAGHYVGGCVNQPALSEGDGNQVLVYASDRPLNLAASDLFLSLGATDAHPAFDKLLLAHAASAESALLGDATSDVAALLDGMREASPAADQQAFDAARTEHEWESALATALGKNAARCLRDPVQRWLSAGLAALNAPDALSGKLTPTVTGEASFTPLSIGGALPLDAGLPKSLSATWSADSSDTLLIGLGLNWQPSRLVTALAAAPARAEFPTASNVEQALALSVGCDQIAAVLLTAGEVPSRAVYADCDQSCALRACQTAVAAAWSRAQASTGQELDTLDLTASGSARVGDDARVTELSGTWVGALQTSGGEASVSGALSGNE